MFVLALSQVYENVQWEVTARKLSKPVLLPVNSDDFLTVCADVLRVLSLLTPPERSHTKVFSGIWWDTEGLQEWLVLKPLTQAELMSFMLIRCGPASPTEQSHEHWLAV